MYYPKGSTHVIIEAHPGWFVAWPWKDETLPDNALEGVTYDQVIAWMIVTQVQPYETPNPPEQCVSSNPWPITCTGVEDGPGWALKGPDGKIYTQDQQFDDAPSWLAHRKKLNKLKVV